ncbi:uncharacterized protein BDR25DRAFT_359435 [Lindgomyces ingoldianus]|uniref:Uncharacterized protein n=1 Tax=Lindgomyces ingoldianus TaxID=673940 RepID=A0ACB6QHX9_9PLEO|nr:uncharacterized protein BDR25DRAFT_359435 [Lindgomyces ingoldianus]KAF2466539.1 hypothetical protein BDR25DRAFT_359435 [Lindgomyces ingoldianus]
MGKPSVTSCGIILRLDQRRVVLDVPARSVLRVVDAGPLEYRKLDVFQRRPQEMLNRVAILIPYKGISMILPGATVPLRGINVPKVLKRLPQDGFWPETKLHVTVYGWTSVTPPAVLHNLASQHGCPKPWRNASSNKKTSPGSWTELKGAPLGKLL